MFVDIHYDAISVINTMTLRYTKCKLDVWVNGFIINTLNQTITVNGTEMTFDRFVKWVIKMNRKCDNIIYIRSAVFSYIVYRKCSSLEKDFLDIIEIKKLRHIPAIVDREVSGLCPTFAEMPMNESKSILELMIESDNKLNEGYLILQTGTSYYSFNVLNKPKYRKLKAKYLFTSGR